MKSSLNLNMFADISVGQSAKFRFYGNSRECYTSKSHLSYSSSAILFHTSTYKKIIIFCTSSILLALCPNKSTSQFITRSQSATEFEWILKVQEEKGFYSIWTTLPAPLHLNDRTCEAQERLFAWIIFPVATLLGDPQPVCYYESIVVLQSRLTSSCLWVHLTKKITQGSCSARTRVDQHLCTYVCACSTCHVHAE